MLLPKAPKHGRIKPRRQSDKKHLEYVASQPCVCCGRSSGPPHHLIGNYGKDGPVRGWGLRAGDKFVIPMCPEHHTGLHNDGNEQRYLAQYCVDGLAMAAKLWVESHD